MPKITTTPGIREVQLKSGKSSWELRIAIKGHTPLTQRFPTKKEAEAKRNIYLASVAEGKSPINRRSEKFTLTDAIAAYRKANTKEVDGKTVSLIPKPEWYRLNMLDADIGVWVMKSLRSKVIDGYIADKGKEPVPTPRKKTKKHPLYDGDKPRVRSDSTVRKLYYTLKKVAKWHAKQNEYTLPDNAFVDQVVPPGWENSRERRLEPGEEEKILAAIEQLSVKKDEWRRLFLWALESGMRAQELLKTCWADINLEHRFLRLRKELVKTKTARQVPLSDKAMQILKEHEATKRDDDDRIFWQWNNSNALGNAFKIITTNAGLTPRLTIHDLRHEATTRLFEKTDLSATEISAITGHQDLKTLQRYTHIRPALLASKMNGKKGKQVEVPVDEFLAFLKWQEEQNNKA